MVNPHSGCAFGCHQIPIWTRSTTEDDAAKPTSGFAVASSAAVGNGTNPDDITRVGDRAFVAFQEGVGSVGEASAAGITSSTMQEHRPNGRAGRFWQIPGKIDGLTAGMAHDRLPMTANEDGNSPFSTLAVRGTHALATHTTQGSPTVEGLTLSPSSAAASSSALPLRPSTVPSPASPFLSRSPIPTPTPSPPLSFRRRIHAHRAGR